MAAAGGRILFLFLIKGPLDAFSQLRKRKRTPRQASLGLRIRFSFREIQKTVRLTSQFRWCWLSLNCVHS